MKVAVLYGNVSANAPEDEEDKLKEVKAVSRSLSNLGYEPVVVPLSIDIKRARDELKKIRPLFVFNLVDTVEGQGRFIHIGPALLDFLKLPYTGARTEAQFMTSNKLIAKKLLKGAGILTPHWISLEELRHDAIRVDGSYIIKSAWEHASIGLEEDSVISIKNPLQLQQEMERRREMLGGDCFAEVYIEGREFNINLVGEVNEPEALPPAEIIFNDYYYKEKIKVVGYRAKWKTGSLEYHNSYHCFDFSEKDLFLLRQLTNIAKDCWHLFELRGYARVDFRVDAAGNAWVLEINANPCLSPDAGFVASAARAGLSFDQTIARIISATIPLRRS